MQTTVDLPDSLYQKSKTLAASRGATVEQFIIEAVAKEVQGEFASRTAGPERRKVRFDGMRDRVELLPGWDDRLISNPEVELPVIPSKRPGTLDLSHFDFDDLLA